MLYRRRITDYYNNVLDSANRSNIVYPTCFITCYMTCLYGLPRALLLFTNTTSTSRTHLLKRLTL